MRTRTETEARAVTKDWRQYAASAILALVCALIPLSPTLNLRMAAAQVPVIDVANLTIQGTLLEKEFILDNIARLLAQQALSQISASTIRWINSGFQGSPAFVSDLGSFLTNIADSAAGEFIYGSELGFLCSPFELNIRAALELQFYEGFEDKVSCTLSGIANNVSNFGTSVSGWDHWFQMTTKPQNNQYGALAMAQGEFDARIRTAQGYELKLLEFGNGFLSFRTCTGEGAARKCAISTPGAVIANQVNEALGLGQNSLVNADELGDVVNALFAQLGKQAITGVGGLMGLSGGSGSSGSRSYLDSIEASEGASYGYGGGSKDIIENAIETEENMEDIHQAIVSVVDDIEDEIPGSCSVSLPQSLSRGRTEARAELPKIAVAKGALASILSRYDAATTNASRESVYREFLTMAQEKRIHTVSERAELQEEFNRILRDAEEFVEELEDEC